MIAIAGATGMVGSALTAALRRDGHTVRRIGRGGASGEAAVVWDLAASGERALDPAALDGVDAVINVVGANIGQRWTPERKREILESRVRSTSLLAGAMASRLATASPPSVFISMSAVGYYGDRGDELLDETSAAGTGFLSEVVRAWERAADPAREAGIRVVHPRMGLVMSPSGGALERLLPVFRMGAGGRVGSGRQWMSWVALTDAVRAISFLLGSTMLSGAVNLTSPHPVRNAEFSSTLGMVLHRPAVAPVPAFVVRAMFGEMGRETLLASQRAVPRALERAGFAFAYPGLAEALAHELSRG